MAKLDPNNYKSAKDVLYERQAAARKRKRDEEGVESNAGEESAEKTIEGPKSDNRRTKKRKTAEVGYVEPASEQQADKSGQEDTEEQKKMRKAEKQAAKRERKRAKAEKSKEKRDRQKSKKEDATANEPQQHEAKKLDNDGDEDQVEEETEIVEGIDIAVKGTSNVHVAGQSSASPSPTDESPILSPQLHSGSSSISSIVPPSGLASHKTPQPQPTMSQTSSKANEASQSAKERLEARLSELRAARKADAPDGRPARNRQELLEMRRKKEEERRTQKKEQRRKAREEEARKQQEEIARRFSPGGSGSLLASPRSPMEPSNNFSFSRVAFGDGAQADATLSSVLEQRKHKGPADPATALKAAQGKISRLSGLDEVKRKDIEEKDMWLNAKKRAHGERVRDDTSLLKKALKRQEGTKKKSEKEWQGRLEGVAKGQEFRQRKREDNLRKRKEEKGSKGKKSKSKKVKRPGFEGSFKGRTGGGKKTKA